ncbi:Sister chromatid cohesion 1 protein 1-like protein [Drosera capensis]
MIAVFNEEILKPNRERDVFRSSHEGEVSTTQGAPNVNRTARFPNEHRSANVDPRGQGRVVVELNESWKVKKDEDPTLLPKSKRHAKFADVTLPENQDTDLGDTDGHMDVSNNQTSMEFQRTAYFTMRLDNIDELGENFMEADLTQHHHQAAAADITLFDTFDAHQTETGPFDRFERFDTELEEETHFNICNTPRKCLNACWIRIPGSAGGVTISLMTRQKYQLLLYPLHRPRNSVLDPNTRVSRGRYNIPHDQTEIPTTLIPSPPSKE